MVDEIKVLMVQSNHRFLKITAGVIIILMIIGLVIFGYRKYVPSPLPAKRPVSHELDTCTVTKEGNPLVESLTTQAGTIKGVYKGKITDLSFDKILNSYLIKLTSLDNSQSYKFMVPRQEGIDFKPNQTLQLSFTCDRKSDGFKITKVLIK